MSISHCKDTMARIVFRISISFDMIFMSATGILIKINGSLKSQQDNKHKHCWTGSRTKAKTRKNVKLSIAFYLFRNINAFRRAAMPLIIERIELTQKGHK